MAGGAPGSSSRGRGGKFKKYTRGGGKHFSRDIRPLDADGNEVSIWAAGDNENNHESSEAESSSEEESNDEGPVVEGSNAMSEAQAAASREGRRAQKKARKEAAIAKAQARTVEVGDMPSSDDDDDESESEDEDMPANPNHSKAARNMAKNPAGVEEITEGVKQTSLSRREREAVEAQEPKEKYMKLHAEGKTDEAKADLERLRAIREQRELGAARRAAEKEERLAQEQAKREEFEAKQSKKNQAKKGGKKK